MQTTNDRKYFTQKRKKKKTQPQQQQLNGTKKDRNLLSRMDNVVDEPNICSLRSTVFPCSCRVSLQKVFHIAFNGISRLFIFFFIFFRWFIFGCHRSMCLHYTLIFMCLARTLTPFTPQSTSVHRAAEHTHTNTHPDTWTRINYIARETLGMTAIYSRSPIEYICTRFSSDKKGEKKKMEAGLMQRPPYDAAHLPYYRSSHTMCPIVFLYDGEKILSVFNVYEMQ